MKTIKFLLFAMLVLSMATACSENDTPEQEPCNIGYVVGYETCGLSLDDGKAKGYIVISEDLKDTLAVYGLPEIFEFPAEAFSATMSNDPGLINVAFPEKFRYAFKMRFTCTLSSETEVIKLDIKASCVIPAIYLIRETYRNCTPVIINSATKMETSLPETSFAIKGIWEVKTISISGELTNIGLPSGEDIYPLFSNILVEIPDVTSGTIEGHTFCNTIYIGFEIVEYQQINIKSYAGTRIAEDEWGRAFSDHIMHVVKFEISNDELTFMDSQNNPLIIFIKKD